MTVSKEQIQKIVETACRAPTGDNMQPFLMHWDGERILVSQNARRAECVLNPGNIASCIALGCLIEALEVAAATEGLEARFRATGEYQDVEKAWLEVAFAERPGGPQGSTTPLLQRCTDRRSYQGGSLEDPVFDAISAKQWDGVRIRFAAPSEQLVEHLAHVEGLMWDCHPTQEIISRYFRLTARAVERTRDGMCRGSLNVGLGTTLILAVVRRSFLCQRILNPLGFLYFFRQRVRERMRSSAALGCVTVLSPTPPSVVEAGRAVMQAWLSLNDQGFGFQPISSATVFGLADAMNEVPTTISDALRQALPVGRELMRKEFGLSEEETPAWFFRTGLSPLISPHARNPRLPVDQVLSVSPAAEPTTETFGG